MASTTSTGSFPIPTPQMRLCILANASLSCLGTRDECASARIAQPKENNIEPLQSRSSDADVNGWPMHIAREEFYHLTDLLSGSPSGKPESNGDLRSCGSLNLRRLRGKKDDRQERQICEKGGKLFRNHSEGVFGTSSECGCDGSYGFFGGRCGSLNLEHKSNFNLALALKEAMIGVHRLEVSGTPGMYSLGRARNL